jgi:phage terminase large subunit
VDQTGIGSGVVDRLRQLGRKVVGIDFGGKPYGQTSAGDRFQNRRVEMWWTLAEWVKGAQLPNNPELVSELTAPTYTYANAAGKLQLESKEDMKDRGLPSPDLADALALTFAEPVYAPGLRRGPPVAIRAMGASR